MYQSRTASSYEGLTPVSDSSPVNGASAGSYLPAQGYRYTWTTTATATRSMKNADKKNWSAWDADVWKFANGSATPVWVTQPDAGKVIKGQFQSAEYTNDLSVNAQFNACQAFTFSVCGNTSIATAITLTQTSSVRADHAISIAFKGYTAGGVTIASNANVNLANSISNPGGSTAITVSKGDLMAHDGGVLAADNISLSASGKISGDGRSAALDLLMGPNGVFNAKAGGAVSINGLAGLSVGRIAAGTSDLSSDATAPLTLHAIGDITASSGADSELSG